MIQFSWNRSLAKRQSAPIHGCIEENMDLGRKTAFLFGRAAVNAALYENCCSLPQLSWQWDIVEAVASNEGQRTSACGFIIFDSRTRFECILCQAAEKSANLRRRGFPRNLTPGGQLKGLKSQNCLLEFEFLAFFNPPFPTTPDARNNQETPIRNSVKQFYRTINRFLRSFCTILATWT